MKVVYCAGPFRGPNHFVIAENIRRAERVALAVWQLGAACLCPHTNTMHFQGAAPDAVWLEGDLEMLRRCDALITVDGWFQSEGARAEVDYASSHQIPVFHDIMTLAIWLRAGQ
jgi:nucleoside 2-deoxyribosyltransferase